MCHTCRCPPVGSRAGAGSHKGDTAKQRFLQEAQAASALDHPNICTIYEINETDDGQLYLVMAHCEGETLEERIDRGPLQNRSPEETNGA